MNDLEDIFVSPFAKNVSRIQKREIQMNLFSVATFPSLTFEHPRMNQKNSTDIFPFKLVSNSYEARENRKFEFIIWLFVYEL